MRKLNPLALVLILSSLFFLVFLLVSGAMYFRFSGPAFGGGSVGVVELNGVIMDSKKTLRALQDFEDDPSIKAVVMRINSPGGAVAPSQEIYEAVKKFKKPLVASMGSLAASGGFYVACGAKKVYANAGTLTGSIGVIMSFANLEKLYDWIKVKRFSIKTGKFKDAGAEYREMTADERALLQTLVDDVLVQFKQAVSEGRHLSLEKVTAIADGRVLTGSQAKALKLVDELGSLQDAVNDVAKQAGIKGKPQVVYPEKGKLKLLDLVMDGAGRDEDSESSEANSGGKIGAIFKTLFGGGAEVHFTPGIYWLWGGVR